MSPKLHVIICSTRPGRRGPAIAHWFHKLSVEHGKFDAVLVDLAEINLPIFDEPEIRFSNTTGTITPSDGRQA